MASVSDMLVGSALQSADKTADVKGALTDGVGIAMKAEQLQQQKMQLEQQKAQQAQAKLEKVAGWFETASKMPDGAAKKAFINNYVPNGIKALGLANQIDPDSMAMLQGDPNLAGFIKQQIAEGKVTTGILSSPEGIATLAASPEYQQFGGLDALKNTTEEYRASFDEVQKDKNQQNATRTNAEIQADATAARAVADDDRQPRVEYKKKIAKEAAAVEVAGGFSKVDTQIEKLKKVRQSLQDNVLVTGKAKHLAPEGAQAFIDPDVKAAQDLVRSSINLKQALDSSFSDSAAAQAYGQSFDRKLPNDKNIEKLDFLISDLENMKKTQKKNFKKEGFDVEGGGIVPKDKKDAFNKIKDPAAKQKALDGMAKIFNVSLEELKADLGLK